MYLLDHQQLHNFARDHHLMGLSEVSVKSIVQGYHAYSIGKGLRFLAFQRRLRHDLLQHRVITHNRYTHWFARGGQTEAQMKAFIVQFSVFSNQFLIAQLHKVIQADSLDTMRASKEILANELGVSFNTQGQAAPTSNGGLLEGSVEGGVFRFGAAHFEWLLDIARALGLTFNQMGKREHGTDATLYFCDELIRLYGGSDYLTSLAASYAVENWAAAGFWKALIRGIEQYNHRLSATCPLGFFTWHDRIEDQHALHTQEELETEYFQHELDEDHFIHYANEMLEGVTAFWDGLNQQRKHLSVH